MTHVLLVDDHVENLYLLRSLLQGHGHTVEEARHGAEALTKAWLNPPDLIISDLLMPGLDGYMLLRHWRSDDRLKSIPFIVYTATYTEPRDEQLAMALGADAFIIKPAEPEPLMARINAVLEQHKRGEPLSTSAQPFKETVLFEAHNEILLRKLEKKILQLEQANGELRDSEERYRDLFHAITDPLFVYDRETLAYLAVNDAAVAGYGYGRDELLRMTIKDIRPPQDAPLPLERHAQSGTGMERSGTCQYRKKDGSIVEVEFSAHDLEFAGRPARVVQARDVTDRKHLEEQLRHSQKMEAVGRLAGGVAHDFNNLLTIISGYSELILATPETDDTSREFAKAISDAGKRATALTRQLLGFSRQTLLEPKVLDLNTAVTEAGKLLRRLIGEDITFTTVLAPDLDPVKVDPGQLDQILMNLAVNARDAMPRGGRLTIETANVLLGEDYAATHLDSKAGHHVMLAVTDTGCGMSRDVMARIFEPFFTTKSVGTGTGLGLAMVFGIVKQSDGCIHVYSEPEHGTTFKIYLPAATGQATLKIQLLPAPGVRGTETILLVEDEEGVRGLALKSLQMHGYQILTAVDGKDALKIAQAHGGPLDLVLTDVVMPNGSGPDLAKSLLALFPRVKVLFMSGYTDDAVVRHGLLSATVSFIQKPFTPLALAQKVRQVLDEGRSE